MYETWSSDLDDWDSREDDNDELIDALYTVRACSPAALSILVALCSQPTGALLA